MNGQFKIVTHTNPHLDEIFAIWLLQKLGQGYFNLSGAVEFVTSIANRSDEEFDADHVLPVGCGGARFDEHRKEGRLANTCAARLVAQYLCVDQKVGIKDLLQEVCFGDNHSGVHALQLASLVKVATRRFPGGDRFVMQAVFKAIDAIYRYSLISPVPKPGEMEVSDIIKELAPRYFTDDKIKNRMLSLVGESRSSKLSTNLWYIVIAMQRTGVSREDVMEWCRFVLEHFYADEIEFKTQVEHCRQNSSTYNGDTGRCQYVISYVESDSPRALSAMRYDEARRDVIVIKNPKTGHVSIFVDKKSTGFSARNLVAMLRWLELPRNMKNVPTWTQLQSENDLCDLRGHPTWYYHVKAESVHNGTLTHPDVPATKLHIQAIIDAAGYAFGYESLVWWANGRGIRLNRR